jgi:peptide/nickel transport system ATP-binding protein
MYAGEVVEAGSAEDIFLRARHPYTRQLIKSFPNIHGAREVVSSIPGDPPNLMTPPPGCGFCPRHTERGERCEANHPELVEVAPGHLVRCHQFTRGVS